MNWEAIGAVAELTGAVGVIASLVYLAVQIRVNTAQMADHSRSLRLSAQDSTTASFSLLRDAIIRDPAVAALWNRALADYDALSSDERVQAEAMFAEVFYNSQLVFNRFREGVFPERMWQIQAHSINSLLRTPGVRQWWKRAEHTFDPEFIAELVQSSE